MANDNDAMMDAARAHWPDMVEEPRIVAAMPGSTGIEVAIYDGGPLSARLVDWLSEERPTIRVEHIPLEDVGPYRLGYGPVSGVLYVGQASD